MNADETAEEVRDRIIRAALPQIPFDGWCWKSLQSAAVAAGYDRTMAERMFPGGVVAAVDHFSAMADRQLAVEALTAPLAGLGMTARVAWLVRQRLEAWSGERETIRRALGLFSLPGNAGIGLRANWRTADTLLFAAGDQASDFSYYTKRVSLSAVFAATILSWLDDDPDDPQATWDFLSRQLDVLKRIPGMKASMRQRTAAFTQPLSALLGRRHRR